MLEILWKKTLERDDILLPDKPYLIRYDIVAQDFCHIFIIFATSVTVTT